jgi:hypothetical protein
MQGFQRFCGHQPSTDVDRVTDHCESQRTTGERVGMRPHQRHSRVRPWLLGLLSAIIAASGGTHAQSGAQVAVTNLSWNAQIAPGATVTVGFFAFRSGTNASVSGFTLNDRPCLG